MSAPAAPMLHPGTSSGSYGSMPPFPYLVADIGTQPWMSPFAGIFGNNVPLTFNPFFSSAPCCFQSGPAQTQCPPPQPLQLQAVPSSSNSAQATMSVNISPPGPLHTTSTQMSAVCHAAPQSSATVPTPVPIPLHAPSSVSGSQTTSSSASPTSSSPPPSAIRCAIPVLNSLFDFRAFNLLRDPQLFVVAQDAVDNGTSLPKDNTSSSTAGSRRRKRRLVDAPTDPVVEAKQSRLEAAKAVPRPQSTASTIYLSDGSDDEEVQADDSGFDEDIEIITNHSSAATKNRDAEDMDHWNLDLPLEEDEDLAKRIEKSKIEMLKLRVAELIDERESALHELANTKRVLAGATQELSRSSRELHLANVATSLQQTRGDHLEQRLKDENTRANQVQQQLQDARDEHKPIFGICRCEFAAVDYNCDFRQMQAPPNRCLNRGGVVYMPPIGSYRYALDVRGKYDDGDTWLESNGAPGEWQVAYHGTSYQNLSAIVKNGFHLSKGKRMAYGKGIYCSPDPTVAKEYATAFSEKGKTFRAVLQVRVDPSRRASVNKDQLGREYWLVPDGTAIRPYGVCIFEGP